ncbi:hypothetical protein [Haloarchaeobius iranensis]|uniref:Uncharacterized protein n=1 Tax=Haloarchaeobius iranensis TaxID=996166 RepID=A0A1G9TX06_9EURY|nr:hypothetical protein [Haloarchaeobius iranensis]SDM52111.1 hypothetical protein SAMN05192554_103177 [Haloarchaeobius iranensis]
MVEVGIEILAGVAVTILLMLVFLGVVVMWDVALALRDVAERVDSLEDDVDSDLETINGTLTRIHDSMRGEGQGRTVGRTAATADGRGTAAERQPQSPPARTAARTVATPGVGTPTTSSGQSKVGGLQAAQPSPEGVVGQVQLADGRTGRTGSDAAAPAGASSAAGTSTDADARATEGLDAGSADIDPDETGAQSDDETDADSTTGESGTGDTAADSATEDDGEADEEPADGESEGGADAPDAADEAGGEDAGGTDDDLTEDGAPATDDAATDEAEADDDQGADTEDGFVTDAVDAERPHASDAAAAEGGAAPTSDRELDGSIAKLLDDEDEQTADGFEPDDSATEAVRTFGQDARTNRGLGPSPDLFTDADGDEAGGRFETAADEPWYATQFESHPRSTGAIAETSEHGPDERPDDADDAVGTAPALADFDDASVGKTDAEPADVGTSNGLSDPAGFEDPAAADAAVAGDSTQDETDAEASGRADPETVAAAVLQGGDAPESEDDGHEDDGTMPGVESGDAPSAAADGTGQDTAGSADTDGGAAAAGPGTDEPAGVGDLVEQELTTLTQEVGGTSISPDVSSLPLPQGAEELDDTEYTFPLSGEAYGLSASAENEVARLELVPDGGTELSGSSEQLLRYQFRNYLGRTGSDHAELQVDGDGVVAVEIPGATADALDSWADALIQITDRTLYLARSED